MVFSNNSHLYNQRIGLPKSEKSILWLAINLLSEKKCRLENEKLEWDFREYNFIAEKFPQNLSQLLELFGFKENSFGNDNQVSNENYTLKLIDDIITIEKSKKSINHDLYLTQSKNLEAALQNNRLMLFHQPIISSKDLSVLRYECLARLEDANGKIIMPNDFIPAAEYTGKIQELDIASLKLALNTIEHSENLSLAINVSAGTLSNENARQEIEGLISNKSFRNNFLTVELTETIAIENIDIISNFAKNIKKNNARIALDDFGSGYTSFKNLLNIPFDEVKIDGHYIEKISEHGENRAFVAAIDKLSTSLGLETIAEKVETESEANTLKEIGVTGLQGYYYGKPKLPE